MNWRHDRRDDARALAGELMSSAAMVVIDAVSEMIREEIGREPTAEEVFVVIEAFEAAGREVPADRPHGVRWGRSCSPEQPSEAPGDERDTPA